MMPDPSKLNIFHCPAGLVDFHWKNYWPKTIPPKCFMENILTFHTWTHFHSISRVKSSRVYWPQNYSPKMFHGKHIYISYLNSFPQYQSSQAEFTGPRLFPRNVSWKTYLHFILELISIVSVESSQALLYSTRRKTWVPHMNYKLRNNIYMYERFTV